MTRPVLLIEDDPQDLELILAAVERAGFKDVVHHASDGESALDYLLRRSRFANRCTGMPAVVILDLKRSGLDGLGALEAIRSNPVTAYLPVVVLTASNLDSDRTRAYQLGANGYVRKPAELDELVKTMGAVAAFWLRTNILPAR